MVLSKLAATLDALAAGTNIDKLWRPAPWMLLVDLRALPAGRRLLIDVDARHPRVIVSERWPETPASPDRETLVFRKLLEGIRIASVEADDRRLTLRCMPRHDATLSIVVQLAGRYPNVAVFDGERELVRLVAERPAIDPDAPPLPSAPDPFPSEEALAWLAAYAEWAWAEADQRGRDQRRTTLTRDVRGALAKIEAVIAKHERELEAAAEADAIRHRGDLLKTAMHGIPTNSTSVRVRDWADPDQAEVEIALDPDKSPSENLAAIFARYRKLVRTQAEAEKRLLAAWERQAELRTLLDAIAAPDADLDALAAAAHTLARPRTQPLPKKNDKTPRLPYRTFTTGDGSTIMVGRSAKDNDRLTFNVASGRDLFLHARDVPGSHVILRCTGTPGHEAMLDAATLAAWNSSARGETVVDVLWTERKHVRRVPGVPGRVTTADAKNLLVRVDPARVERLYATLAEPPDA